MTSVSGFHWWGLPAIYLLAFALTLAVRSRVWMIAHTGALVGLGGAIAATVWSSMNIQIARDGRDAMGFVVAILVALLGWVIVRFSWRYLEGEAGHGRYVGALLFTLAAVSAVVVTHHLGVLVLAWAASSLGLHHLLTFYRDRAPAQIAAHKKFLVSRMAELCLLAALLLIYRQAGTLTLYGIARHVAQAPSLSLALHVAAILIALAAILKSAQLPLHGWLIQVMEAPTPVSALLHAGIVNIGGFVLIRQAELISAAPGAQTLLVVNGSLTAALAGLVMMTRISVKVRLAWSTCAQMGFMLMECGLGLYELALLHLVAHSLYKAYAFLTAGETVLDVRRRTLGLRARSQVPSLAVACQLIVLPIAVTLVGASVAAWQMWLPNLVIPTVAIGIVGLGLAPLLWVSAGDRKMAVVRGVMRVLLLTQIYLLLHCGFAQLVPAIAMPSLPLAVWVGVCFSFLYVLQVWLLSYPRGALATRFYRWAYAGFYLDESFTRLTFRVWPAPMSIQSSVPSKLGPNLSGKPS